MSALGVAPALRRDRAAAAGAVVADARDTGFALGNILPVPAAQRDADFDRAKAMGATWLRLPFDWVTLEMNGKGKYNWAPADAVVNAANARGLKILAVVSYTPGWARPAGTPGSTPPTRTADYGDFLAAAARRYAPMGVHAWELWNEPNLVSMWSPKPDVVKYTAMLKDAYPKIKAADPSAVVVTGGTSPGWDAPDGSQMLPLTFVKGIYANGGKGYFDAVAHHPYSFPYSPTLQQSWNSFQQSKDIYNYMASQGDGAKKVWGTEFGFPTGTNSKAVTEQQQGDLTVEGLEAWENFSFHGPIFVYSLRDVGTNLDSTYDNMGNYTIDGRAKASVLRLTQALRAPQHVKATAGTGSVNVTWDAPGYDYGTPIDSYVVTANPGGAQVTVGASARSASVTVPNLTTYTFTVQPVSGGVPGVASVPSNPATPGVPSVYPTAGSVVEGNSGTRTMSIPVYLSKPSTQTVTVKFQTFNLSPGFIAAVPQDYDAANGTVTFAPGETRKSISVTVKGDTVREVGGDKFLVALSSPTNANIGGYAGLGTGTIVDDD